MITLDGVYKQLTIKQNFPTSGYSGCDNWTSWPNTYWGKVQLGTGREFFGAKRTNTELEALVEVTQYIRGLNEKMRITIDGVDYEIISAPGVRELGKMELKLKLVR